jgi:ammonia channel protein AmtB
MESNHTGSDSGTFCLGGKIDTGDTTWVLIATILVMGMLPALAFFEAGLLRSKNTLSIITQIIGGFVTLTVMWDVVGYSLTFSPEEYVMRPVFNDHNLIYFSAGDLLEVQQHIS